MFGNFFKNLNSFYNEIFSTVKSAIFFFKIYVCTVIFTLFYAKPPPCTFLFSPSDDVTSFNSFDCCFPFNYFKLSSYSFSTFSNPFSSNFIFFSISIIFIFSWFIVWTWHWTTFFRFMLYWIKFYTSGLTNLGWYFLLPCSDSLFDCWALREGGCNSNLFRIEFSLYLVEGADS